MEKLFLIDAYALIFRFHYALISRPMRNAAGMNTSAIFGFAKFLHQIIEREKPHYLGVAFDPRGGNFRHILYPLYKANRSETPEEIRAAVPEIKRLLEAMHIPILEVEGYEADDVIGTLSHQAACCGQYDVYMVTPDKDYGQLIRKEVSIYKPGKGGEGVEIVGMDGICANYGISDPRQVIDILALWGDASDNIPGVPGIGEKGARKLIAEWGDIDNLLAHADQLSPKLRDSLTSNQEQLRLARRLVTIDLEVPIEFHPESLRVDAPDYAALRNFYLEHNFSSLLREVDSHQYHEKVRAGGLPNLAPAAPAAQPVPYSQAKAGEQLSLFDPPVAPAAAVEMELPPTPDTEGDLFESMETTPHTYHTVDTPEALARLIDTLGSRPVFCFDTETSGIDPLQSRPVGLSFSVAAHEAWWVPTPPERCGAVFAALKPLFENPAIAKIGQNIKFDLLVLMQQGIRPAGFLRDTMIMHYLLDPESRHGMDFLAERYLGYRPVPIEALIGRGAKQLSMEQAPPELVASYAAEDADVPWQLDEKLWPEVAAHGARELYATIEEPLIGVLARMERAGIYLDPAVLQESGRTISEEAARLEAEIRTLAGSADLNVNSSRQLGEVLFEKLKLAAKPKLTKTKQYSTDEEYLATLTDSHPIVGKILEYRGLKKLLSTYIEALPLLINPATGRIHSSFNQAVTATGRLSSTNPNLQNIPIRDEVGRAIRRAFTAPDDDHVLLSADYSQVELRIMAHLSGDQALCQAFLQGEDVHTATAAKIYGVSPDEVTREQRRRAKTANFGIIYGISAFGLAQRLNIPRPEAKELIEGYFRLYPQVQRYMQQTIEQARERGYVETLFGRRRYLPELRSANAPTRAFAERNAINAPIQGSAADIMKIAMIRVDQALRKGELKARIVLQVHDELVVEVPKSEQAVVTDLLREAMSSAATLAVPLDVEVGSGSNWMDAH